MSTRTRHCYRSIETHIWRAGGESIKHQYLQIGYLGRSLSPNNARTLLPAILTCHENLRGETMLEPCQSTSEC
jgi:hypothetical protein